MFSFWPGSPAWCAYIGWPDLPAWYYYCCTAVDYIFTKKKQNKTKQKFVDPGAINITQGSHRPKGSMRGHTPR